MAEIELTKNQQEIMREFYGHAKMPVVFNKQVRKKIWESAKGLKSDKEIDLLRKTCPAVLHQIQRSLDLKQNIQSAVFSECVYAQTLANLLELNKFVNCYEDANYLPDKVLSLLHSYSLVPRYVYSNEDKSRMLIQAGGCGGVDSALITVVDLNIYTIEFKEPWAKSSEPDLPKYSEDGQLKITNSFAQNYPQFLAMLEEHKGLNFFQLMGQNEHNFTPNSINMAITNNYKNKKFADVVCTEDKNGYLVMLPINQISAWARIEGEIRPAGRNHYAVWTPVALHKFLLQKGAVIKDQQVRLPKKMLSIRKARGGAGAISGYKINPLFFIYNANCREEGEDVFFNLKDVQQLNPTIAAKMDFKKIEYEKVKKYYFG